MDNTTATPTANLMPETSEKFDLILKQLMMAKMEMGSIVRKDSANPFHKSKYASLGAHLELCESTLASHDLLLMHTTNGSTKEPILIATLYHIDSGQWIKSYLPLPNPKNDSQGLGASITYMRRYSINAMLGLTAEDDDGETASGRGSHKDYKKQPPAPIPQAAPIAQERPNYSKLSAAHVKLLTDLHLKLDNRCKTKMNSWLQSDFQTTNLAELPASCFAKVLKAHENAVKLVENEKKEQQNA
jgi:ERF superfamily protein